MMTETAIDEFIVKLRLGAIIAGIEENVALAWAAAQLRLATEEITQPDYDNLVDEIFGLYPELDRDRLFQF